MNKNGLKVKTIQISEKLFGRKFAYSLKYFHSRGRWPNLKNPQDLSEILISRMFDGSIERYGKYVDKVQVREYVKEKGLCDHLLKHYGYWDDASKITLDELPDTFVLKASNGYGGRNIFVCRDKRRFDLETAKKKLAAVMNTKLTYEKQYNVIKPHVICEELIDTGSDAWPTDYKFTCIHGQPVDIFLCTQREKHVKYSTRNLDWSVLNNTKPEYLPDVEIEKPKHLAEMIEIAKTLSSDFDFVRVDLYEYKDTVYFGELTFSPWGGIMYSYTDEAIKEYGRLLRERK